MDTQQNVNSKRSELCLIGKICSDRVVNKQSVLNIINGAWKTKSSFTINPWEEIIISFSFLMKKIKEKLRRPMVGYEKYSFTGALEVGTQMMRDKTHLRRESTRITQ